MEMTKQTVVAAEGRQRLSDSQKVELLREVLELIEVDLSCGILSNKIRVSLALDRIQAALTATSDDQGE